MQPQTVTKAVFEQVRRDCHHLALNIGLNPAARALGIPPDRVRKWAERGKWRISLIRPQGFNGAPLSQGVTDGIEATKRIVEHYGDRAKIGATIAGARALEHLADADAVTLVKPAHSIAADQWTKAVDRAAGWTQSRAAGVNVGVQVNIQPPSEAERAERRSVHAKLDEITRALAR